MTDKINAVGVTVLSSSFAFTVGVKDRLGKLVGEVVISDGGTVGGEEGSSD